MPLIKPLTKIGHSRFIVIPASWLRYHEEKTGRPVEELLMELNGEITLRVRKRPRKR